MGWSEMLKRQRGPVVTEGFAGRAALAAVSVDSNADLSELENVMKAMTINKRETIFLTRLFNGLRRGGTRKVAELRDEQSLLHQVIQGHYVGRDSAAFLGMALLDEQSGDVPWRDYFSD